MNYLANKSTILPINTIRKNKCVRFSEHHAKTNESRDTYLATHNRYSGSCVLGYAEFQYSQLFFLKSNKFDKKYFP